MKKYSKIVIVSLLLLGVLGLSCSTGSLDYNSDDTERYASPFTKLFFVLTPSTPEVERAFALEHGFGFLIDHVEINAVPKEFIQSILSVNPDAQPTIYYSLSEIKEYDPMVPNMDEEWFVHCHENPAERLIYAPWRWHNWLADISEPEYRKFWIQRTRDVFREKPYRALFIDVAPATHTINYWFSCAPEKWPTQEEFNHAWRSLTATFLQEIKDAFPDKLVIANSVRNNYSYIYSPEYAGYDFAKYVDGICIEPWLYPDRDTYGGSKWKEMMNRLIKVLHDDKWVVLCLECLEQPLNDQQMLYGLASFLLLRTDHLIYGLPVSIDVNDEKLFIPLGMPTDDLKEDLDSYLSNRVYMRSYENGMVLVNPGDTQVNYSLSRTMNMVVLNGNKVSYIQVDELTLAPTSGAILLYEAPQQ